MGKSIAEINDKIRGKGTLKGTLEAIRLFSELKEPPVIRLATVIANLNMDSLEGIVDFALKNKIAAINFSVLLEWESNKDLAVPREKWVDIKPILESLDTACNGFPHLDNFFQELSVARTECTMFGCVGQIGFSVMQGNGFLAHIMGTQGLFTKIDLIKVVDHPCRIDQVLFYRCPVFSCIGVIDLYAFTEIGKVDPCVLKNDIMFFLQPLDPHTIHLGFINHDHTTISLNRINSPCHGNNS